MPARSLAYIEDAINFWLRPKVLAESWDNVGMLVGSGRAPSKEAKIVERILVCNDLKPEVLDEAIEKKVGLVVAYHPTIFSGIKSVGFGNWKEMLIAKCLAHDVSVYCPHSSLDAVAGGMNDHVIEKVLKPFTTPDSPLRVKASQPSALLDGVDKEGLLFESTLKDVSKLCEAVREKMGEAVVVELDANQAEGNGSVKIFAKGKEALDQVCKIAENLGVPQFKSPKSVDIGVYGSLRVVDFPTKVSFPKLVESVKTGLNLDYVQYGHGCSEVQRVAICVGAGSSLVNIPADLYITGEMSHHSILDATIGGTSVILCNHCCSERHFLSKLASILKLLTDVEHVYVSEYDKSPLALSN